MAMKRNKLFSALMLVSYLCSIVLLTFVHSKPARYYLYLIGFGLTGCFMYWFYRRSKALQQIGELVIAPTGFEKIIGNYRAFIDFKGLQEIELLKYYPAYFSFQTRTGAHSYVLKFDYTEKHSECFLISETAINNARINIFDNLKFLEKTLGVKLKVK
jgi:hypothetical protein